MIQSEPDGATPLCQAIRQVTAEIRSREASLRGAGKRAVVVIASDGAASDGDVHAALRPLKSLPAWVVVRLCTDDDAVVQYWNAVDEDLELDMDVLDDLAGEAAEVTEANPSDGGAGKDKVSKMVEIETGYAISVPQFIKEGDLIRIDTEKREYLGRDNEGQGKS